MKAEILKHAGEHEQRLGTAKDNHGRWSLGGLGGFLVLDIVF